MSPNSSPVWPITEVYARYILHVYKPWSGDFDKTLEDKSAIEEYKKFLKAEDCPELVKIADQHALTAYTSNNKARHQPTAENDFPDIDTNHPDIDDSTRKAYKGFETLTADFGCDFSKSDYNTGLNYDCTTQKQSIPRHMTVDMAKTWLIRKTDFNLIQDDDKKLEILKYDDGNDFLP